jgi:hypothetical protein
VFENRVLSLGSSDDGGRAASQAGTLSEPERLLGKVMREARDTDFWRFTTPQQVWADFDRLRPHLGRRPGFREHLLRIWRDAGLLGA